MTRATAGFLRAVGAALLASALLTACSTDDTDSTFGCTGGGTTLNCLANTQYCEQASDGTTTTGARCLAVPTGCAANPCDDCLRSGANGILVCSSIRFGTTRATTVSVRR